MNGKCIVCEILPDIVRSSRVNGGDGYRIPDTFGSQSGKNQLCEYLKKLPDHDLEGVLNHKIAVYFQKYQHLPVSKLASLLKRFPLDIQGIRDAQYAQVMKGGLSLKNTNEDLEIKKYPGMYAIGEILNVAGMCGGYNLHFALASAYRVAEAIERKSYVKNS